MLVKVKSRSFSLIEVVLAVGVFAFVILALLALLGPVFKSASQTGDTNRALAVMSEVETYLRTRPFREVYGWLENDRRKVLLVYKLRSDSPDAPVINCLVEGDEPEAPGEIELADGVVFKIILAPSNLYQLTLEDGSFSSSLPPYAEFEEGYLPIEVRIYGLPAPGPGADSSRFAEIYLSTEDAAVAGQDLMLVYNTAVNY